MTTDLTKGNPFKIIIMMSLPIMFGNFFQTLYSTADAVIVGRYLGSNALAAVGATNSVYFMIMWFVCGMSGGYAVVLAQHFGAGEIDKLRSGVCIALELGVAITAITTTVSLIGMKTFLSWMNIPEEILGDATTYIYVIVAGMLATMFYNLCAAILRAMGDSRTPFIFVIVSSIINIILDVLFISTFSMGVFGAALATVISQMLSGIACAVYMCVHFEELKFKASDWKFDLGRARKMLSYGIPAGLCGVTTAFGILILQIAINLYGTTVIAAYTAAIKVQNVVEVIYNAFSLTMINYAGQNVGAGEIDHLHKGYKQCMIIVFIISIVAGVVCIFWGGKLASLYVDAAEAEAILGFASQYLKYAGIFLIPFCILLVTRSTLQGMGFRSAPVIIGVMESVLRIICTMFLIRFHNEFLICLVSPVIWTVTAIAVIVLYTYWIKHLRKVVLA